MSQRISPPNPEFELHRRRLLVRRRAERRYGTILVLSGCVYFLLVPVCLVPLLFLHGRWVAGGVAGLSGAAICLYFALSGAASIHASRRPVTSREVRRKRRETRQQLYHMAQGELPPDYTLKGRIITLVTGSSVTITGTLTLLFFLIGIPELAWARILLGIVAVLVESMLILDILYIRAKAARDLPAQSALELSLLLASGELTAGEGLSEEK
jgi:hypothetical protein